MDSQAQLDDELSFTTGDVIDVIEEQDSDWLIGMSIWKLLSLAPIPF